MMHLEKNAKVEFFDKKLVTSSIQGKISNLWESAEKLVIFKAKDLSFHTIFY